MLNVTVQNSAAGAKQYFSRSDYYTKDSQELVGVWGGKSSALLGLAGEVKKQDFERLCDNLHPETGKPLTSITRENRRVGYDFTWSAPKSISVVHALTGDERIVAAFRQSISETMSEMEGEMETRVRKKDADYNRLTGNLAWAEFLHLTSRPVMGVPAPQLHAHLFAFNATYDLTESKWKAGNFGRLKADSPFWQAMQQVRFANRLQELGYSIRKTKDAFEIVGVPESVIKKFSMRRGVIERAAEQFGITTGKGKELLAKTTREAKVDSIPYSDLVELWDKMLTPNERVALVEMKRMARRPERQDADHVKFAVDHLFQRSSVVDERRLVSTALRHGIGVVTPEGVKNEIKKLNLLRRERGGKVEVTTQGVLEEERRLVGYAVQTRGSCRPLVRKDTAIAFGDQQLDAEQRAAVELPMRSSDRISIIRGLAGTGKSRSMFELVQQLESRGKEVTFVTPKATGVEELRGDGLDAHTLARLLVDPQMQLNARDAFIILDEAGMVDTPTMNQLFDLARDANAKLVLLGDKGQLGAVNRGSPLRILEEQAGLKVVEISKIRRQEAKEYQDIVKLLARGKTGEGLQKLDELGRVKLMPVWDSYQPVAQDYAQKVEAAAKAGRNTEKEVAIIAPTHSELQKVNAAVRKELRERKLLGQEEWEVERLIPLQWTDAQKADRDQYAGEEVVVQFHRNTQNYRAGQRVMASDLLDKLPDLNPKNFDVYGRGVLPMSPNELIRTTAKGKTADNKHTLHNGSIYRVQGRRRNGDIILQNGWVLSGKFGHWMAAYANTTHVVQGRTVLHGIIAQSAESYGASSRENFYVAASRFRKSITIFTDDRRQLKEAVQRTIPRLSALELVKLPKTPWWQQARKRMERIQIASMLAAKAAAQQLPRKSQEMSHGR